MTRTAPVPSSPVDVATGVVHTLPLADLLLPGPLPLAITRSYSSASRHRDCGLGFGWSHSLDWEVTTDGRAVRVRGPHGVNWPRTAFTSGTAVMGDLEVVRIRDELRVRDARDQRLYWFRRQSETGAAPTGARVRWSLARVSDVRGNEIHLVHEGGRLCDIRDSAGRRLRVARSRAGRIRAFEVFDEHAKEWMATRRYDHDDAGDLVGAFDGYGRATRFRYVDHLLVEQRGPDGFALHYRYDATRRCIATWGAFDDGTDVALDDQLPRLLADQKTPARGALHHTLQFFPGFVEVTTSAGSRRFFTDRIGNVTKTCLGTVVEETRFDPAGRLLGHSDGEGATTRYEYDADGALKRVVDPLGGEQRWQYDANGLVAAHTSVSGLMTSFDRDPFGDVLHAWDDLGPIASYYYDARGLVTQVVRNDAGATTMTYDAAGNRTGVRAANGAERRVAYTHDGRPRYVVDERGRTTHFAYGRNRELLAVVDGTGATLRKYSYDRNGRLEAITLRNGTYFGVEYGGFDKVVALRRPDGSLFRFSYDREGNLVRVRRPDGAEHRFRRDAHGRVIGERFFDGRERTYGLDKAGRVVSIRDGARTTRLEWDALSRLVAREHDDGSSAASDYDAAGRVLFPTIDQTSYRYLHETQGAVVRDEQVDAAGEAPDLLAQLTAFVPAWLQRQLVAEDAGDTVVRPAQEPREPRYEPSSSAVFQ
jgi:YD repeat-containing protein